MVFPVDNVGAPFCHEIGHLGLKIRKIFACGALERARFARIRVRLPKNARRALKS